MSRHMTEDEIRVMLDGKRRPGRPSPYPWERWRDGQWWMAEQGTDFTCTPESFRSALYRQGKFHGLRVEVQVDEDIVHFRFVEGARYASKAYKPSPEPESTSSDLPEGMDWLEEYGQGPEE